MLEQQEQRPTAVLGFAWGKSLIFLVIFAEMVKFC